MPTDANQAAPAPLDAVRHGEVLADVAALRDSFEAGTTRPLEARLAQLDALARGLRAERPRLLKALEQDLGKSRTESLLTELGVVGQEIAHMRRNLRSWLRPRSFGPGMLLAPASGQIRREPLGTTLIISPWNYPVNLALAPLIGAIAGGNTALLKPSEVAPATSAALAHLVRATSTRPGCGWSRAPSLRPRSCSSSAST